MVRPRTEPTQYGAVRQHGQLPLYTKLGGPSIARLDSISHSTAFDIQNLKTTPIVRGHGSWSTCNKAALMSLDACILVI